MIAHKGFSYRINSSAPTSLPYLAREVLLCSWLYCQSSLLCFGVNIYRAYNFDSREGPGGKCVNIFKGVYDASLYHEERSNLYISLCFPFPRIISPRKHLV